MTDATEAQELPPFECPICKSKVQQQNAAKHLLNQHNDSRTLHRYVKCEICLGLFAKDKLTPHMRKAHGAQPPKNQKIKRKKP